MSQGHMLTAQSKARHHFIIVMFAICFTITEILAVEMCMTLALTFRIGQGQLLIFQSKVNT